VIFALGSRQVEIRGDNFFIADNASVIGSVVLENNTSIWFNVVVRADNDLIHIGENSNVQDGAVLHTDPGFQLKIGKNVTVGHKAMLHGCTVGDNTLIGINSVILNGAKIGRNCLIGANSMIPEGKEIPDGSLVIGSPGKVVKALDQKQLNQITEAAQNDIANFKRYKEKLRRLDYR